MQRLKIKTIFIVLGLVAMALLMPNKKPEATVAIIDEPIITERLIDINVKSADEIEIVFTNFFPKDSTGSTHRVGSQMETKDFKINKFGWYTYDNHVVVGAATTHCLKSNQFGCEDYNSVPESIAVYSYWDTFRFEYMGEYFDAVVLDSCGACHLLNESDNGLQRFDIMIPSEKYRFGKIKAKMLKED